MSDWFLVFECCFETSVHTIEPCDSSESIPVCHKEVAILVEADPVGGEELSILPRAFFDVVSRTLSWVGIVAEVADQPVLAVENGYAPSEIGNSQVVAVATDVAGAPQHARNHTLVVAFHVKELKAVVFPVANNEDWFLAPCVHEEPVWRVHLAWLFTSSAKAPNVLSVGRVLVHPRLTITVGNEEAAVRLDGDGGGSELILVLVDSRLLRVIETPDHLALESRLEDLVASRVGEVEELIVTLANKSHPVKTMVQVVPPASDEIPLCGENHDRVFGVGVDVEAAFLIDHNTTVCVSQWRSVSALAPIGNPAIGVAAIANQH